MSIIVSITSAQIMVIPVPSHPLAAYQPLGLVFAPLVTHSVSRRPDWAAKFGTQSERDVLDTCEML